jgi:hypothetical protein
MNLAKRILTALFVVISTSPMVGCAGLTGGEDTNLVGLPSDSGDGLALSGSKSGGLPYEVRPSHEAQTKPDAGRIYGAY